MATRTTRSRAAALKAARDARAQVLAEQVAREKAIETALADFFEGATAAESIRGEARARAERIMAAAEERASDAVAQSSQAVRTLRALDQTNAQIAELCGISTGAVRAMATENEDPPNATRDREANQDQLALPPEVWSDANMPNETAG